MKEPSPSRVDLDPSVTGWLRRLALTNLSMIALACLVVFAVHESAQPWILGWSWRYVLGVVLPLVGLTVAQGLLISEPTRFAGLVNFAARLHLVSGALVLLLGFWYLPPYELPLMAVCLGLLALPLSFYRASG